MQRKIENIIEKIIRNLINRKYALAPKICKHIHGKNLHYNLFKLNKLYAKSIPY